MNRQGALSLKSWLSSGIASPHHFHLLVLNFLSPSKFREPPSRKLLSLFSAFLFLILGPVIFMSLSHLSSRHKVKDVSPRGICTASFTMSSGCLIFVAKLSFGAFYVPVTLLSTSLVSTHLTPEYFEQKATLQIPHMRDNSFVLFQLHLAIDTHYYR